jgi:hypothetical protein
LPEELLGTHPAVFRVRRIPMASEGGSSSAIVAIFAIMLLALIGGFIAWQAGVFGGGDGAKKIDVEVKQPAR